MSILWKKGSWDRRRIVVLLFVLLCLFVTGIRRQNFKGEETETSIGWDLTNGPMENLELDETTELTQVFYAQDGILDLIYIGINGHGQTGSMIVTVRDANGKEIAVRELPCNTMIDQGAQGIGIYTRVKKGEMVFLYGDVSGDRGFIPGDSDGEMPDEEGTGRFFCKWDKAAV